MKKSWLPIIVAFLVAGCGEPHCVNNNPAFDRYALDSREYNAELLGELQQQDSNKLSFWISRYISINDHHYMEVNVRGERLCTKMIFEVGGVKRLENFITIAGESYSGAELRGVTYTVDSTNGSMHFVMTGLTRIID